MGMSGLYGPDRVILQKWNSLARAMFRSMSAKG
jgi:hypothetical protein